MWRGSTASGSTARRSECGTAGWICYLRSMDRQRLTPPLASLVVAILATALPAIGQDPAHRPMAAQTWFQNYKTYLQRAASVARTGDAHYKLGRWAWRHGLEDEAWEQWTKALAAAPDHAATREATGYIRGAEGWTRPGELKPDWLAKVKADGRALAVDIAIQDDADAAFFSEFRWRLLRLSWFLWQITEGQVYLEKIEVADQIDRGRFTILEGKLDIPVLEGGGATCYNAGQPDWTVTSGGRCYVRILAHEMLHGIFGLPDERHGCYCLMQGGLYGIKTPDLELCDDASHRPHDQTPRSCWSIIRSRYPQMRHPNPVDYGRAPEVEIVIRDN